ncbi:MAG: hemolysin III family protein [Alphaproteobacteria bacterium]|nr:hemolysin III family protein [Alphaproteobacteria bacterium]
MGMTHLFMPDEQELAEHYPNRREWTADGLVHAFGLLFAAVGGVALFYFALERVGLGMATTAMLYALCLIAMLACSAAYNLTHPSKARRILRRLDEAAIFVLIAGSYTPFTVQHFDGWHAFAVTGAVWALALMGAIGKVFLHNVHEVIWCVFYVAFGWLSVLILPPISGSMSIFALALLAAGGLIYTSGVVVFLAQKLPYRRAIWHTFVVAGAALHYGAVFLDVAHAASMG